MNSRGASGGLAGFKSFAMELEAPLIAYLELTHRCRWNCTFCCNRNPRGAEELTVDEWFKVLGDLRRLGCLYLTLTGGDPLMHPAFTDVARQARHLGMAVRVFTNGGLIDEAMADILADLPCLDVQLSIHGATAASHDAVTRVPGSFQHLSSAIDRLAARDVPIVLKSPLTIHNENELSEILALAENRGLPLRVDPCITARDDGGIEPLRWRASDGGVAKFFERLAERDRTPTVERVPGQPVCGVGRNTVAVDPIGEVFPCIQWRHESLGKIRETSLAELWRQSAARRRAAAAASAANRMLLREGGAVSRYPFCPAISARHYGDPLEIDSATRFQAESAQLHRSAR